MNKAVAIAVAVVLFSPAVLAQHVGFVSAGNGGQVSITRPAPAPPTGMPGRHFAGSVSVVGRSHRHSFGRNPYYGWSEPYYYADDYGPDYGPEGVEYVREEPTPQPAPQMQVEAQPVGDPVLLELHGTQWVKVENFGVQSSLPASNTQTVYAKEIPPAVLVYRDGHSEEVSSYSIIGRVMYTKGDYYSSGSWTRTIQLADLDLPATLKQNQDRGVKFDLPSGPNEVVLRP